MECRLLSSILPRRKASSMFSKMGENGRKTVQHHGRDTAGLDTPIVGDPTNVATIIVLTELNMVLLIQYNSKGKKV